MLKSGDSFTFVCPTIPSECLQSNTYVFSFEIFVLWLAIEERDSWYIQLAPPPPLHKMFLRPQQIEKGSWFCLLLHQPPHSFNPVSLKTTRFKVFKEWNVFAYYWLQVFLRTNYLNIPMHDPEMIKSTNQSKPRVLNLFSREEESRK